jgi:hypothetical protein
LQSDENFTTVLKQKLEEVEDAKYKGIFSSLSHLYKAWPGPIGGEDYYLGWSADVIMDVRDEDGNPQQVLHRFAWDGIVWKDYGPLGFETPETIRQKYESLDHSFAVVNKIKLDTIEEGAQKNVQSNWLENDEESDAFIDNKPDLNITLEDEEASDTIPTANNVYFATIFQPIVNFLKWTKEKFAELPIFIKDGEGNKFLSDKGEYVELDPTIHTEDTDAIKLTGDGSSENPLKAEFVSDIADKIDNIKTDGDGTKFLSDDGTYKEVEGGIGGGKTYFAGDRITIDNDDYIHADLQTDNNFTDDLRDKLEGLESPKYKGVFPSIAALETAHPTGEIGDSADVIVEVIDGEGETVEEIRRFIWNGTQWEDKGTMGADTPEMIRQKYESLEHALANQNKKRLDELDLMIESGELSGTVKTKDSSNIKFSGDGSEANPLTAEFTGEYVPGEGLPQVFHEDTVNIIFKGKGTPDDPLKGFYVGCCHHDCGGDGGGGVPPTPVPEGRELKFIVRPEEVREVSVFNAQVHNSLIIEYIAFKDNLMEMGTIKLSANSFFRMNVVGDNMRLDFSWNGRMVVRSENSADVTVHCKLNYFNKLD